MTCMHRWNSNVLVEQLVCRSCGILVDKGEAVLVGDRIQISVELIRQMSQMPDFSSALVKVSEIRISEDGSKVLVMERL